MNFKIRIKHIWNGLLFQLSFFLLTFYLTVGSLFLFSDLWADIVPVGREIIGSFLVAFACLRFYIAYRRYKTKKEKIHALKEAKKEEKKKLLEESQHVNVP